VLFQLREGPPLRFRCHTGHAYSAESLVADVNEAIEVSLYTALRALEEGWLLLQHVATHQPESDAGGLTPEHEARMRQEIEVIRKLVTQRTRLATTSNDAHGQ
jgi:two-component system chemotaxis response regulator CheB